MLLPPSPLGRRFFIGSLTALFMAGWSGGVSSADSLHRNALVVSVASGDTFTVRSGDARTVIHLAGIRAPRTGEPYAGAAKRALGELLFGQQVDFAVISRGDAERVKAEVRLRGMNVNAEMVRRGWAAVDDQTHSIAELFRLEKEAKLSGRGMWGTSQ